MAAGDGFWHPYVTGRVRYTGVSGCGDSSYFNQTDIEPTSQEDTDFSFFAASGSCWRNTVLNQSAAGVQVSSLSSGSIHLWRVRESKDATEQSREKSPSNLLQFFERQIFIEQQPGLLHPVKWSRTSSSSDFCPELPLFLFKLPYYPRPSRNTLSHLSQQTVYSGCWLPSADLTVQCQSRTMNSGLRWSCLRRNFPF